MRQRERKRERQIERQRERERETERETDLLSVASVGCLHSYCNNNLLKRQKRHTLAYKHIHAIPHFQKTPPHTHTHT